MTRLALYLQDAHPIPDAITYAQYAEQQGFEAVWQADSRLVREAGVPMAAFAATTESIKVGSGVIDIWSRNPARLASLFSTLDDLAPGRIICGLGAWWDPLAAKVGIDRSRPLRVMREVRLRATPTLCAARRASTTTAPWSESTKNWRASRFKTTRQPEPGSTFKWHRRSPWRKIWR